MCLERKVRAEMRRAAAAEEEHRGVYYYDKSFLSAEAAYIRCVPVFGRLPSPVQCLEFCIGSAHTQQSIVLP